MDVELDRKIVTCRTLPSLPAVALEIVAVCRKDDLDLRDVTALLYEAKRSGRNRVVGRC